MTTNDMNEQAQPDETTVLSLALTKDGQLKVSGVLLGDKTACYGLLEAAKDLVREMHQPKLVKPNGGMINFVRSGWKH